MISNPSFAGSSCGAVNAPIGPVSTVNGATAAINDCWTEHAGIHFEPHVTTGVAPRDYLDKMLAEPFADFTFSPVGAAVYHLGEYGTAAKKLTELNLKP